MKVKIKSFNGNLPDYLTLEKWYKIKMIKDYCGYIVDDEGVDIFTFINNSSHLGGGSWEVVDDE